MREVTVKSISMAMGIRKPGFQLISISESDNGGYADRLCLLPDQLGIYLNVYLPCFIVTVLVLFVGSLQEKRGSILPPPTKWARRRGRDGLGLRFVKHLGDVGWAPLLVFSIVTLIYTFF